MKLKSTPALIFCLLFSTFLSAQTIHELWSVNALNSFVLIGSENMDGDTQKELVFLEHSGTSPTHNPRIVILDGLSGAIEYDSGAGLGNHFNIAGFNWTTDSGANISTGTNALHDIDNDGIFELIYNRNGQFNEVLGYNGNAIAILFSVNSMNTFVLIGAENMDGDTQKELVFLEHTTTSPAHNPRIVIFDGLNGAIDYDSGAGLGNHFNVAGFNWTTDSGSNINTGTNALHDIDNDGIFELAYNRNGQFNEVLDFNGSSISTKFSVNALSTFVLIGAENMDGDAQKELVFLEHTTTSPAHNPRIVIFDGLNGAIDYDSGAGLGNHFNVAGFNWTTDSGSNINTGTNALHDIDNDGIFELAYNRNGQFNEVLDFNGSSISTKFSVNALSTFVLIGTENMDGDAQKELVFLEHTTTSPAHNPRIVIFDGLNGAIDYDSGAGLGNHFNVAGFNWTTDSGSNINTGTNALHDIDNDGIFELAYNRNGQFNEVLDFNGSSISTKFSVNALSTFVLIGTENMDGDAQKELVFLEHTTTSPAHNPRIVIFDGLNGAIDYDSGAGLGNHFNVAGFNWTTDAGANINTGTKALFDIDNDGVFEMAYNLNGTENILIGMDLSSPTSDLNHLTIDATIFPNPVSTALNLKWFMENSAHIQIEVWDVEGKRIAILENKQCTQGEYQESYQITDWNLAPGYYLCVFKTSEQVVTYPFVVER